jgi:hypothetical protein
VQLLAKLAHVDVSVSQLYRVTEAYGAALETEAQRLDVPDTLAPPLALEPDEVVYVQLDGSMVFTDDGWKEAKLGRVFRETDSPQALTEGAPKTLTNSVYAGHIGHYLEFCRRSDRLLAPYAAAPERLVFITDGALWVKEYLSERYPEATQILDFYHVKEHLAELAQAARLDTAWLDAMSTQLLDGQLNGFIDTLRQLTGLKRYARTLRDQFLAYVLHNEARLHYADYRRQGFYIGSGAVEAAHRTVVQARMKRSGQRWSPRGARHMLQLRVTYLSHQEHRVLGLIRSQTIRAA